jgi:glycosyltransferase involved in cell wall biosynthesis
VSVFILTYNEEQNLEACLSSLSPWAGEIFLVDSHSTDGTLAIGERYGVHVIQHRFEGHSAQRNWALKNLSFRHEWILALDADHRVTAELSKELAELLPRAPKDVVGYFVKRRQVFRGRWIRHGGYYPKYMLKLFRRGAARCDDHEFDYRFYVVGLTGKLQHDLVEDNQNEASISFWIDKHNRFATEQAVEELKRRQDATSYLLQPCFFGNPDERVLWFKQQWYRLPLFVRPFLYFFYRYVLRFGFLDGKQGFIFHFLQAFWFRLLVDIKLEELAARNGRRSPNTVDKKAFEVTACPTTGTSTGRARLLPSHALGENAGSAGASPSRNYF